MSRVRRKYDEYIESGEYGWFPISELYEMPGGETDDETDAWLAENPDADW